MTLTLYGRDGAPLVLPDPVSCHLDYTWGVPCDAFSVTVPASADLRDRLPNMVRFTAEENGERLFTGLVDETSVSFDAGGSTAEITGRGMAARLLDNEVTPITLHTATTEVILRRYVTPFGVTAANSGHLSPVSYFSVSAGSSAWSALYSFARYHNGIPPRFDRMGQLHLEGFPDTAPISLTERIPVLSLRVTEQRYGCLSSVVVLSKNHGWSTTVTDPAFTAEGGCAQRVITHSANAGTSALRASGRYQLNQSQAQRHRVELTVSGDLWAFPGDRMNAALPAYGVFGLWRVAERSTLLDHQGRRTRLLLAPADVIP